MSGHGSGVCPERVYFLFANFSLIEEVVAPGGRGGTSAQRLPLCLGSGSGAFFGAQSHSRWDSLAPSLCLQPGVHSGTNPGCLGTKLIKKVKTKSTLLSENSKGPWKEMLHLFLAGSLAGRCMAGLQDSRKIEPST